MTKPVDVHLKDIDIWEVRVFKLQVGTEGGPLGVEGDGPDVGDVAVAHGYLRSVEITPGGVVPGHWG